MFEIDPAFVNLRGVPGEMPPAAADDDTAVMRRHIRKDRHAGRFFEKGRPKGRPLDSKAQTACRLVADILPLRWSRCSS